MDRVELHQAWMWDCPECGVENFARSVDMQLSREESIEMARKYGEITYEFDPSEDFNCSWQSSPGEVTCKNCNKNFDSRFDVPDDDDDE